MEQKIYPVLVILIWLCIPLFPMAQNVGINTETPAGKLHVKGSADISQLVIDADAEKKGIEQD